MTGAADHLLATLELADPYAAPSHSFEQEQITALNERFAADVKSIAALGRVAEQTRVRKISRISDVIPLLFSHTSYKNYPATLVDRGNWSALAKWLDMLSVNHTATQLDFAGVNTIDEWIGRLNTGGHFVLTSSGTSGKCSIMNQTAGDVALLKRMRVRTMTIAVGIKPDKSRVMVFPAPRRPGHQAQRVFDNYADVFGRADRQFWLSETPLLVADINRAGAFRQAMMRGTVRPSEVSEAQAASERARERNRAQLRNLAEVVAKHHQEPMMVCTTWGGHWHLTQALREINAPKLHPDSVIGTGGGLKGLTAPANFEELILAQYGVDGSRVYRQYSCTEIASHMVGCRSGRYHVPPWVIPIVLEKNGERLAPADGSAIEGRMAFFDFAVRGRWGGLITGDKVTFHTDRCDCGRSSSSISRLDRYADLEEGEEKLTCAGTMEAYVRGELGV